MPRTKEQNEAMRLETQRKIQLAAIKLFAEKGFAATGVQTIADAAGISIGLLYRHYKTKDDIFGELVEQALSGLVEVESLFKNAMSPVEIIQSFASEIIEDINSSDDFVHFMLILNQPFVSNEQYEWMDALKRQNQVFLDQIAALIQRGQNDGTFRNGNPAAMAQYLLSTIVGICMMKQALKERFMRLEPTMLTAFLLK